VKTVAHNEIGFTLVEVMVSSAIATFILAGLVTTHILSLKSFRALSNYAEIHADGRNAVDQFSRDMRSVYSISYYDSSNLVVLIPTAFSSTGGVLSNKTISFSLSNGALRRTDSSTGATSMLATNVYKLTFSLYDKVGTATIVRSTAKGVQVDIRLRKSVMNQIQSEDYLSARLDMRNKP